MLIVDFSHHDSTQIHEQAVLRGCGIFILNNIKNSNWKGTEQPKLAFGGKKDQKTPGDPFWPKLPMIL